jgi:hypothetical protein
LIATLINPACVPAKTNLFNIFSINNRKYI